MYSFTNGDIMKEVDSFIAQAKLEGDISGSSSSNISINHSAITKIIEFKKMECEKDSINKVNGIKQNNKETNACTNIETFDQGIPTTNCLLEHEKLSSQLKDQDLYDANIYNNNSPKYEISSNKGDEEYLTSNDFMDGSQSPNIIWNKNYPKPFRGKEDEDSCDSSFVDLGSESNRSKMPYVMWLQGRRSKQSLLKNLVDDGQTEKKVLQREEVHLHQVNSALFWERWMDHIFDKYDQWVQTSDSDTSSNSLKNCSTKDSQNRYKPTKVRSEPTVRTQSDKSTKSDTLKYKSPSYVDWLVQRRQERTEISDNEEINESKMKDNYWSSLYRNLTKSLSSIFLASRIHKEEDLSKQEQAQNIPLVNKSLPESPRVTSNALRRCHSHSCSYHNHGTDETNEIRCRQLSQDSVGSPVLTDQLVELVCNTLNPESSDSSSDEDIRRRKPYRRNTKRKY